MKDEIANLDNRTLRLLQQTAEHFQDMHQQAYLVGGSVRNIILVEPCSDWDIVVTGDAPNSARRLANKLLGHYTHMHDKASRIIVPAPQEEGPHNTDIIFDIAPLQGKTLENDLRQRDFTINAIAVPLEGIVRHFTSNDLADTMRPIDPLHGIADIDARRLKAVNNHIFLHDPLRILRAVRLMMRYHLSIEGHTEGLLMRDSSLLPLVAPERIHDELYAILAPEGAAERLQFLDAHGILTTLIPEFIPARGMLQPEPHHWDVLDHSIQTVSTLEQLATLLQQPSDIIQQSHLGSHTTFIEIKQLLIEAEQQGIFHTSMLTTPAMKLAALLHDIGKPPTYTTDDNGHVHFYGHPQVGIPLVQHIMKRLGASTRDNRLVQQITDHHMRPGQLGQQGTAITPRATRRYFVDLGPIGIAVALFSLADHMATRGPTLGTPEQQPLVISSWEQHVTTVCQLLTSYICDRDSIIPPRLISAEELMRRLNLTPSPLIGQLLDQIAEAQAEGKVHSKEEALWFAEEKLQKKY